MKGEWNWAGGGENICSELLRKQFLHPTGSRRREAKGMMGWGGRREVWGTVLPSRASYETQGSLTDVRCGWRGPMWG